MTSFIGLRFLLTIYRRLKRCYLLFGDPSVVTDHTPDLANKSEHVIYFVSPSLISISSLRIRVNRST
jgi:hypothetical protein